MNSKKRILWCGESSLVSSGFGLYTKEILSRLYATGKYEIAELSCYRDETAPRKEPWTVYPVAVSASHALHSQYMSNDSNQFGQWRFDYALLDFKPNIVIDVRDFWNFTYQDTSCFRQFYHWMLAPTYDSSPPKIETINSFKNADTLMFHTEWARNDLTNNINYSYPNIGPIVNDSVDPNIFKPIGYSKAFHKIKHGIDNEYFIVGSVMRNQKRKLIPDILQVLRKVLDATNKKIFLYLHTSYPDSLCWDLPSLLLEYNVQNNVLLTYKCTNCNKFYPSVFKGPNTVCKHCKNNSSFICSLRNPIRQEDLNEIYNLFDIYVQYAICEGFGIPALEAASVGLPVISVDFGAMGDVGKNIGAKLIPIKAEFRELETNAIRCYPDNDICASTIVDMLSMDKKDLNKIGKESKIKANNNFSWEKTAKIFEQVIDGIDVNEKLPWNYPHRHVNGKFTISDNTNIREFIYSIIDNIICESWLKNTTFIEDLIKSVNDGYVVSGTRILPFNKTNAIKILELYMNNKIGLEMIRKSEAQFPKELQYFFEYSKKS